MRKSPAHGLLYFGKTNLLFTFSLMNLLNIDGNQEKTPPAKGKVLIAAPFLNDPNFSRSVVLLCEHGDEGTLGFVLNQPTALTLGDLVIELEPYMPPLAIHQGGPVQPDTLHIMHRMPALLGGVEVAPGIYWGGSFETLKNLIKDSGHREFALKLFVGYSGWSAGQLEKEMEEGAWLVGDISEELLFESDAHLVWKKAITMLGKNYAYLANMPIDPQLN